MNIGPGSQDATAVEMVQRQLNIVNARLESQGLNGLGPCPLTINGDFDVPTEIATIAFQVAWGLPTTGVVDDITGQALQVIVDPPSGLQSGIAVPLEGVPRWSVSMADFAAVGQAPSPGQLQGLSISIGGQQAGNPNPSPDQQRVFFTPPALAEGLADLTLIGGDGSIFVVPQAIGYSSDIANGLLGLAGSLLIALQEAAQVAATVPVGRLGALVDGVAAAVDSYEQYLAQVVGRLQELGGGAPDSANAAWVGHMATRARLVCDAFNEQCRLALQTDAIATLDGMPFAGADDEPGLDTGAQVLLMTAIENVIVPSFVDLTV